MHVSSQCYGTYQMNRSKLGRTLFVVAPILLVGCIVCGIIGVILRFFGMDIHYRC
jgi:hypothetical protein